MENLFGSAKKSSRSNTPRNRSPANENGTASEPNNPSKNNINNQPIDVDAIVIDSNENGNPKNVKNSGNGSNASNSKYENDYESIDDKSPPDWKTIKGITRDPTGKAVGRLGLALNKGESVQPDEIINLGTEISQANATRDSHIQMLKDELADLKLEVRSRKRNDPYLDINLKHMIKPPTKFGEKSIFTANDKNDEAILRSVPGFYNKFSGKKTDVRTIRDHMRDVVRWHGTRPVQGTKLDFIRGFENTLEGEAKTLFLNTLESYDNDIDQAMMVLFKRYNKLPSPQVCRETLHELKAFKNQNLDKIISRIIDLASSSASIMPDRSKKDYQDLESISTLLRILPTHSKNLVTLAVQNVTKDLGRNPTFNEVVNELSPHESIINKDISDNCPSETKQKKRKSNNGLSVNISAITATDGDDNENDNTSTPSQNTEDKRRKPRNKASNSKPKGKRQNFNKTKKEDKCSLCGLCTHIALHCTNMRNDKGKVVTPSPHYGGCNICPDFVVPNLMHPPNLCPFRPNGVFTKKLPTKSKAKQTDQADNSDKTNNAAAKKGRGRKKKTNDNDNQTQNDADDTQ